MSSKGCIVAAAFLLGLPVCGWAANADTKPYQIVDGKVDDATFRGWRAFHTACHACHGVDAGH
jgi:mono/diheme cytochrome c family protein